MLNAARQPPLVSATGIYKTFAPIRRNASVRPDQWVLDGVSLSIGQGESLGLVGESGSGKSTLGRIILGLTPPTRGTVTCAGANVWALPERDRRAMRGKWQIVFQDPLGALNPRRTISDNIELPLINAGWPRARRAARVDELMGRVGLDARHKGRYPHQFSGGQCQRVVMARAIALDPEFLFLDEPVSALDLSVQAQILNLLAEVRAALGLTCLFVSHDLKIVRHVCERTAVMYHGQLVETGPSTVIFDEPRHPYTRALRSAVLDVQRAPKLTAVNSDSDGGPVTGTGCRYAPFCHLRKAICIEAAPELSHLGGGHWLACHAASETGPMPRPAASTPERSYQGEPAT
jgi:oligopeptide/dipeptide ABC transporter ATP-binding protein